MKITSPNFQNNGNIPVRFTCDGENINPALRLENVPPETQSLALVVDDPDAPSGTFVHWLLWNISPDREKITQNSQPPEAKIGQNSSSKITYIGPCPPSGTHRYFFKLYALNKQLKLASGANKEDLLEAISDHILTKAELIGRYARK